MIRKLTVGDAEVIYRLNKNELGSTSDLNTVKDTLSRILDLPVEHYVIGYEQQNQLVGYLHAQKFEMLYSPYTLLNVISMAVDVQYHGVGIGTELMHAIEEIARDLGLDGIRINSGFNREGAHRFYEKSGYRSSRDQKRFLKIFNDS